MNDDKILYNDDVITESINSIQSNISFSHEASFAQQVYDTKQGLLRVLSIPIDTTLLIGLVSPAGLQSIGDIEDTFLHKVNKIKEEYSYILNILDDLQDRINKPDPMIVINRSDDQIIASNESALTFFKTNRNEMLNSELRTLQDSCSKTSKRKLQIDNRVIGKTDCSVVTYTLQSTDKVNTQIITEELQTHTEHLLKLYKDLQTEEHINRSFIEKKIEEVNKCYHNIIKLHNNEKKV